MFEEYPKWFYKNGLASEGVIVDTAEAAEALGWQYCGLGLTPVEPKPPVPVKPLTPPKS